MRAPALPHAELSAMAASAPLLEVVLPRLVNELVEQGEVALVLDDFHRLSSARDARHRRLVRRAPPGDASSS